MKKKINTIVFMALTMMTTSCIWTSNVDDDFPPTESAYEVVIMQREAFENAIELLDEQAASSTGKIYVKDQYLLINEPNKGFHIYDNSNPENPQKIKFLKVLGSSDISIKGDVLYINNAVDLIAVTYTSDFSDIQITKRIRDVFPPLRSPDGFYPNTTSADDVVIDWTLIN